MYETVFVFSTGAIVCYYLCTMTPILSRCYKATANARIAGLCIGGWVSKELRSCCNLSFTRIRKGYL